MAYAAPVMAYQRKYGNSITGGFVYRGRKQPSFKGVYIFDDYNSKRIFDMSPDGNKLKTVRQIGRVPQRINSFSRDADGRRRDLPGWF
ncbi:MAG TPA: hypothetical protein VGR78_02490 [Verrucomicrobiae bacterium]|nr:hypothetical protein [Verrucomicrobiae bacterium]